ncbi:alkylhydroperoxidase AhpD family core domain-containing protein [Seinonella peptonophila]|uniref:Alkylhydroperoxidase AhpD family core domain-containing protein n=1 Tax=Seinonella peptonophila TaxID=112248 RepID=A0A1M4XAH8_9BACL|nr:carboxymuconolactone decarboxylase family protein [Seinonella peptonophila]SHE90162.1 alkylhydroperoxidase AhpD family core domain-containing protein [Seinonella peptonophila]
MEARMKLHEINPKAYQAMLGLERYLSQTKIDPIIKELIKIRASQLNGCAFCIDMHTKDARKLGETEQRIYALNAWRETNFFSPEEQAVLALTEAVTLVAETHVPDDVYQQAKQFYNDEELSEIIMAIVTINGWNRICVTTRRLPGE